MLSGSIGLSDEKQMKNTHMAACDQYVCDGEKGKKETQNGFFVGVRSRSEAKGMVKNGLMVVACLPLRTRMMSGAGMLSRTMIGVHTAAGV